MSDSVKENSQKSSPRIEFNSQIVEDWEGGYKLELDLKAQSNANDWKINFKLPYAISAVYGVDIIDKGNGNYTISGQDGWANLKEGQEIKPIIIVNDNQQLAKTPEATDVNSNSVTTSESINTASSDKYNAPEPSSDQNQDIAVTPDSYGKTISVDNDFDGDLANAIANANDGDVVQLGSNIYYTNGITLDKDITINGQTGSVVNGGGTGNAIFDLTSGASGATIQNIEITNGNNGITGNGASNLSLDNLDVNNIGINQTNRDGTNNVGISLGHAEGLNLSDSKIHNIGRKGVAVGDTDGATVSGLAVYDVNLAAQHAQSHDAAGIKFFNTNNIVLKDSNFANINAMNIWNDTTNGTVIDNNVIKNVGQDFLAPGFNNNVDIHGIYNEKSSNSIIKNNSATAVGSFAAFNATEFTTETMTLENNNNFSSSEIGTQDYWVNEEAEKLIALTENPDEANFDLFADEYYAQANI